MSRTSLLTAELTTGGWTHEPESWYHDHIPQSTYIITLCYLWPAAYFSHELDVNNYCYRKMHTHPIFLYQNIKVCVFFLSKRQNDVKFQWLCLHCWDHKQGPGHWKKPVWGFQASTFCSQDCICSLWATTPLFYEQHEAQTSERNAFFVLGVSVLGSDRSPPMTADVHTDPDGAVSTFTGVRKTTVWDLFNRVCTKSSFTTLPSAYHTL